MPRRQDDDKRPVSAAPEKESRQGRRADGAPAQGGPPADRQPAPEEQPARQAGQRTQPGWQQGPRPVQQPGAQDAGQQTGPQNAQNATFPGPTRQEQVQAEADGIRRVAAQLARENIKTGGALSGMLDGGAAGAGAQGGAGALLGAGVQPIGREQIMQADVIRMRYKQGKAHLDQRITEDEQWYKLRHWECLRDKKREVQPVSAWLFNAIANKHADAMDAIPAPTVLAREESDKEEAKRLTSIVPVVLDLNDFEETYSQVSTYKLKTGTGVYGVFWDPEKYNGVGDISIKRIDLLNLFWEPGVSDIQDSPNLFFVTHKNNSELLLQYPQLEGHLGGDTGLVTRYVYDESIDMSDKSYVVDWYYKTKTPDGRQVLHYCRYCNDVVLFATQNTPEYAQRGWYDHGEYPFVFDVLFPVEGMPTGFGYIDVGKDVQAYIDRANQAIMENLLANARPRHFINSSGSVNEAEYADITQDFVHVDGNLGQDSILPIEGKPLGNIYWEVLQGKIDEIKETTGNRDVSNGGTTGGATAASAIAAMQESGGKLSRDHSKSAYRAYRRLVLLVIELIRQFYTMPRQFRIIGEAGAEEYITYTNAALQAQAQDPYDLQIGRRLPLMDIKVGAQKASPYSKMAQNELAVQLYQLRMFDPTMSDQALIALKLMDFDGKDEVMQRVAANGQLMQMIMQIQQQLAMMQGGMPPEAGAPAGAAPAEGGAAPPQGNADQKVEDDGMGGAKPKESYVTRNAREQAAQRVQP